MPDKNNASGARTNRDIEFLRPMLPPPLRGLADLGALPFVATSEAIEQRTCGQ